MANQTKEVEELKMAIDTLNAIRFNTWKEFYNTLNKEYGKKKAVELSGKALMDAFRPLLKGAITAYGIERNAKGAAELMRMTHAIEGIQGEIVESSEKRAVIKERVCPCSNTLPNEWCKAVSQGGMDLICAELNPKLTSYHVSYMTAGDSCCEIVFELKD
jgi:hypothetical protein